MHTTSFLHHFFGTAQRRVAALAIAGAMAAGSVAAVGYGPADTSATGTTPTAAEALAVPTPRPISEAPVNSQADHVVRSNDEPVLANSDASFGDDRREPRPAGTTADGADVPDDQADDQNAAPAAGESNDTDDASEPKPTFVQHGASMEPPDREPIPQPPAPAPDWTEISLSILDNEPVVTPEPAPVEVLPIANGNPMGKVGNASGCQLACITSALIHPNSKFSHTAFEIETTVPTRTYLWIDQDQPIVDEGEIVVTDWWDLSNTTAATNWSTTLPFALYETSYWVTLLVVDEDGHEKWAITEYTTIDPPQPDDFAAAGEGCVFQCIVQGYLVPGRNYSEVRVFVETDVVTDIEIFVSESEPGWIGSSPILPADFPVEVIDANSSAVNAYVQELAGAQDYHLLVKATDHDGHTAHALGTFTTADLPPRVPEPTDVLITFHDVTITENGDHGTIDADRIALSWGLADGSYRGFRGPERMKDGDTVDLPSNTGVFVSVPHNGTTSKVLVNAINGYPVRSCGVIEYVPLDYNKVHTDCTVKLQSAAVLGAMTIEQIESLPHCAELGLHDWRNGHRCAVVQTGDLDTAWSELTTLVTFGIG